MKRPASRQSDARASLRAAITKAGISLSAKDRKRLGLRLGDEVLVRSDDGGLRLGTPLQSLRRAQGEIRSLMDERVLMPEDLVADLRTVRSEVYDEMYGPGASSEG